ncbi:MAG: ATP-binding protein [Candidatus Altarchaeum sp.]|nr:ATP-binding protein [Candidatus Altarchaeum sp.]
MNKGLKLRRIEFFNREKEKEEIMNILEAEPKLITFIYGPINSGKTSLITDMIENLPENYVVIYINLRERAITSYEDFLETIFDVKYEGILAKIMWFLGRQKDTTNEVISELGKMHKILIPKGIFNRIFKEEKPKNAFIYILNLIKDMKSKGKNPVFIIDELQKIGDVKTDDYLIYDIFNFFIRLTKELHICHVFALSSDSLFIEKVYNEAMLQGRANYILVDDFDEETTNKFLEKYNFKETNTAIKYFGGKPGDLTKLLTQNKDIETIVKENLDEKKHFLTDMLDELLYIKPKIEMGGEKEKISVERDRIIGALKEFKDNEEIKDTKISRAEKIYLVKKNMLFVNSKKGTIKPQSKIDLLAIRDVLKEIET